jgi:NADH:ubiquinone oxidoreductase subunit 4 (subunit M)
LMPLWVVFFFVFILGNFGMPGTVNFIGEFCIFIGSFIVNSYIILLCIMGLFFTLIYSLILYTRISMGTLSILFIRFFSDICRREFYYLFSLFFFIIFFGLYPNVLFDYSFSSIYFFFWGL